MNHSPQNDRLLDLLADEQFDLLTPEDRAELDALRASGASGETLEDTLAQMLLAADEASGEADALPPDLASRITARGQALVGVSGGSGSVRGFRWAPLAAAAALLLAGGVAVVSWSALRDRDRALSESRMQLAAMEQRIEENQSLLSGARASLAQMESRLAETGASNERALAEASRRATDLAQQLAIATADLDRAQLTIAQYEQPADPAELAKNRTILLEVPGSVRLAWQPFDLPDNPAEQRQVQGDVVWNDELQQGYLRFVGLAQNDPSREQYQVWVIDERGLEQKVSGGVFNASAEGEVIVPIHPGIDVGRVALFAITIENPGGTWVPDLSRRVVVAPREG